MADLSTETIRLWWYQTRESSWESLLDGLDTILANQVISPDLYSRVRTAVANLMRLGVNFPVSYTELESRLDYYL